MCTFVKVTLTEVKETERGHFDFKFKEFPFITFSFSETFLKKCSVPENLRPGTKLFLSTKERIPVGQKYFWGVGKVDAITVA